MTRRQSPMMLQSAGLVALVVLGLPSASTKTVRNTENKVIGLPLTSDAILVAVALDVLFVNLGINERTRSPNYGD